MCCSERRLSKTVADRSIMLLKQNEDKFNIVVTNVYMNEIDGIKLLEAGLEHDIPVIMTLASDEMEMNYDKERCTAWCCRLVS